MPSTKVEETKYVLRGVREALASASRLRVQVDSEAQSVLVPLASVSDAVISGKPKTKIVISGACVTVRNVPSKLMCNMKCTVRKMFLRAT